MKPASWQEAIPLAKVVYARTSQGCCAHIILEDCNVDWEFAQMCLDSAREKGHEDCIALCEMLAEMSTTQRTQLFRKRSYDAP